MDFYVKGKGKVTLSQSDFVGQGGQGAVYAKGDVAYKIYADPARMIPTAKIQELSALALPTILRPQEILLDPRNTPIGYTMPRVQNAVSLCQLFTRAFRDRRNVTPDMMLSLVRKLQDGVQYVHERGMLLVDLHEMNFLVDAHLTDILFVDVDSYQTPGFPATALMDTVRDRHSAPGRFNADTDWFSFGIVSFQMFIGIHPFKGKHPTVDAMDARMLQNLSVLNKAVAIPKVCYPFDVIPSCYLQWYRAVFEQAKRCPPPFDLNAPILLTPTVQRMTGSDHLNIQPLGVFPAPLVCPLPAYGPQCGVTTHGLFVRGKQVVSDSTVRVVVTPRMNHLIAASLHNGKVRCYDVNAACFLNGEPAADAITTYQNRLYIKHGAALYQLEFLELSAGIHPTLKPVGNVLPNASQVFEGVVIQNMLGAVHATLFPRAGSSYSVRLKELDRHRIVDARFDNNVLMLIGANNGAYDKFIVRFDLSFQHYDLRIVQDIAYAGLNFVTLDNGLCVHLNESEELELFSNRKESTTLKVVTDEAVRGAQLFKNGTQVLFSRGDTLYSMSMKSH